MRRVPGGVGVVALVLCCGCGRSNLGRYGDVAEVSGAADGPLVLFEVTPPPARVGEAYLLPLRARGGTPPYSWRVSAGALPDGLALVGSDGASTQLHGTPAHSGTHSFSVEVTDGVGAFVSRGLTLVVRGRVWALYRGNGLYAVDLTRPEGSAPVALSAWLIAPQPGGSVDLLGTGTDGSVFGVDLGGTTPSPPVPLTGALANTKGPTVGSLTWSKDGTRLAYLLGSDSPKDLCVVAVAGGDTLDPTTKPAVPRRISAGTDWSFTWAGATLIYSTLSGTFKAPLDPPGAPEPLSVRAARLRSVAPDDTRLVYAVDELDAAGFVQQTDRYLVGLNGRPPAVPVKLDSEAIRADGFTDLGWTPDSQSLVYWGRPDHPGGPQGFFQLRADGIAPGLPQLVTDSPCAVQESRLSHDRRWLAFSACGLWLADLDNGTPATPRRLAPDPGPEGYPISRITWSSDDARLLWASKGALNALDMKGGATGTPANLYAGLPEGNSRAWTLAPDGAKVAVRVVRGPRQEIYLVSIAGPGPQAPIKISAAAPDGFYQYTPDHAGTWSADGSRFVYEALVGEDFHVFAVNLDGAVPSNARRISTDQHPTECCDTQTIVER